MRRIRIVLILLLTAALIITGAFLPRITTAVMDLTTAAKVSTAPMQSVQLDFRSTGQQDSGSILKKLALEQSMYTVPITAKDASMTEEEVFAAVETCMDMYVSSGIFSWFEETYRMAEPYLAIAADDTDNASVIWAVHFVHEDDPYRNLFLHLDDETGKILYLDYVTYDPDSTFYPEDQAYALETFTGIFFEQLGLTDLADSNSSSLNTAAERMQDGDVWCLRFTFPDTQYGEVVLEFYVKPTGFYILFPN